MFRNLLEDFQRFKNTIFPQKFNFFKSKKQIFFLERTKFRRDKWQLIRIHSATCHSSLLISMKVQNFWERRVKLSSYDLKSAAIFEK